MCFHLDRPNESTKLFSHSFTLRPKMQVWFEKTKTSWSESRNVYYSYSLILGGPYIQIHNWYINIYLKFSRFKYVLKLEQNPKRNLATIFYSILILSEWLRLKVWYFRSNISMIYHLYSEKQRLLLLQNDWIQTITKLKPQQLSGPLSSGKRRLFKGYLSINMIP